MKIKIRSNADNLIIYREKIGVAVYVILAAITCLSFGVLFFYIGRNEDLIAFVVFGIFSFVMGLLILLGLPKYYGRLKTENGASLLVANNKGLLITPILNAPTPYHYEWELLEKIIITRNYIEKRIGESYTSQNLMLVYLLNSKRGSINFVEYTKRQISYSPKGNYYMSVPLPNIDLNTIKEKLDKFSDSQIPLTICNCVEFNYKEKLEEVTY